MSKPARSARSHRLHEIGDDGVHVGARHLARHLAVRDNRAGATPKRSASCRSGSGWSMPSHISWVEPLRPAWPSCRQNFGAGVGVHEIDDALPGRLLRVVVHAGAAGRDARLRRDVGHLGEHQPRAADRAGAVMHHVPVAGHAVDRRVLAHRRHHHAVGDHHVAQPERLEHRRDRLRHGRPSKPCACTSRATTCRSSLMNAGARSARLS